jgi:chromosome segregation ATPase
MAITREEIFSACDQIFEQGKTPRIEAIRSILGSGSYSTIAKYLREWKEQAPDMPDSTKTDVPQELVNAAYDALKPVLALIWDKASEEIDSDRVRTLETENDKLRSDLEELAGLRTTNKALLDQIGSLNQQIALARAGVGVEDAESFEQLQAEKEALASERDALITERDQLNQLLEQLNNDVTVLQGRLDETAQERQALKEQNQELAIAAAQAEFLREKLAEANQTIEALRKQIGSKPTQMTTIAGELWHIDPALGEAITSERQELEAEIERLKESKPRRRTSRAKAKG